MNAELPPPSQDLDKLTRLIGVEATLRLIEACGGELIYIPQTPQDNRLTAAVGKKAAARMSEEYPRMYFKVPVGREWLIRVYRAQGRSYNEIARNLKCSRNTVHRVLQDNALTKPQLDLFDR